MGGGCGYLSEEGMARLDGFLGGTFHLTVPIASRAWEETSIGDPDTVRSSGLPQSAVGAPAAKIKGRENSNASSGQSWEPETYQAYPACVLTQLCLTL